MDQFPLHLAIFGLADRFFEPFCYGCAGFLLSFRISRSILSKVVALATTVLVFLWMDDIWPGIATRKANIGAALGTYGTTPLVEGGRLLGQAEFYTGEVSGLWDVFVFSAWDLGSALFFIPLAFFLGLNITGRRWNESISKQTDSGIIMISNINKSESTQPSIEQNPLQEKQEDDSTNNGTEGNSLAYSMIKVPLKFLAIIGIMLCGILISALLIYAGIGRGLIPALIVFWPVLYGLQRVWKSEGGKPATYVFFGLFFLFLIWSLFTS